MNSAKKVGKIFLEAGRAFNELGDAVMTLYNCTEESPIVGGEDNTRREQHPMTVQSTSLPGNVSQ